MKKAAIALAVLLGVVLVAVALGPGLVGRQLVEPRLAAAVREATGRELTVEGDLRFSLLPDLTFTVERVRVANAPGGVAPDLLTLASLTGKIRLLPLLRGQVVVEQLHVQEPVVHLELLADGRPNWRPEKPPASREAEGESGSALPIGDLTLSDVRLQQGIVTFRDARTGRAHELRDIELALSLPELSQPLTFTGELLLDGEAVKLAAAADQPRALLNGGSTPLTAELAATPVRLTYDGSLRTQPDTGLDGQVGLDIPSLGRLAGWLGQPLPAGQPDPGPVTAAAALALAGARLDLRQASLEGKALRLEAKGSVDAEREPVRVDAEVDLTRADLDAYLPAEAPAKAAAEPGGWDEEPLDLNALKRAQGRAQVRIGEVRYRGLPMRGGVANLALEGGVLTLGLDGLGAAEGTLAGQAKVDDAQATPAVSYEARVAGVQARPLLHAFAGTDRLSGTVALEARGAAQGGSVKALMATLDGDGRFQFLNGAIHGINIAAALRQARKLGLGSAAGYTQATDFAELGGSFTITDGVIANQDLALQAPLLRLSGSGQVALPPRTLDYQIIARLVGTLEGQGGAADPLLGLPIPVRITGTFDQPAYGIDWQAVFREAAKDPARLARMPQELRELGKSVGVDLPIPAGPAAKEVEKAIKAAPGGAAADVVKGLTRGLLGNQ